jgi:hypothetical protein
MYQSEKEIQIKRNIEKNIPGTDQELIDFRTAISLQSGNFEHLMQPDQIFLGRQFLSTTLKPRVAKNSGT